MLRRILPDIEVPFRRALFVVAPSEPKGVCAIPISKMGNSNQSVIPFHAVIQCANSRQIKDLPLKQYALDNRNGMALWGIS